jgi:6-phosphogluconolactonase
MSDRSFLVLPSAAEVAAEAADRFVSAGREAIEARGRFCVALSGGSTPRAVYPLLTAEPLAAALDWRAVEFFWGDERSVPPDDPESNFGVGNRMLVSQLPGVRDDAVHRMPADAPDRDEAAARYAAEIERVVGGDGPGGAPAFDLIWLGMGADGHTASLFPGSAALDVVDRWVVPNWAPGLATWRMTLTYPAINAARQVMFVVTGRDKAAALAAVRAGGSDLPSARVAAARTAWIVDDAAAGPAEEESEA